MEEKVVALVAYRMAKGLYSKCGEKWFKAHKCATSIQLNALQEVWDLLELDLVEGQQYMQADSEIE
jgi:hypothetical protein